MNPLNYLATRIAPKFGVSVSREFTCAEGATEISPVLTRSGYAGKSFHKIILPLLAERGEGRGEESKSVLCNETACSKFAA